MALARAECVSYAYASAAADALTDVSLELDDGEVIALLGPSGSGKSTLVRALAGLIPHFHGGRFRGRVEIAGCDTRRVRPADLAGRVASVFQDPEDQVVMGTVMNEVAFGLENIGAPPADILTRAEEALDAVGTLHLAGRATSELSGGELQRVTLASAIALRPRLLLLDEPTSQLDPEAAEAFLGTLAEFGGAVVLSEQRVARALRLATRVLFVDRGRIVLDAQREEALEWLAEHRSGFVPSDEGDDVPEAAEGERERIVALRGVGHAYRTIPVLDRIDLDVLRGEVVVLEGPNGSGKTTLAKIAAGLLEASSGHVSRRGTAGYVSQDPGRYLMRERVDDEVALAVGGDLSRARAMLGAVGLEWAAERHPRDLSSGERERLALAAVAVSEPDLLVLDEPTRGIDPERKQALASWVERYAAAGHGVLVATHDRGFPAHRRVSLGAKEQAHV